tara:strand:+ start:38 stop:271 length:234 start_codon:yes stop_codon:yes gene_type:complete
MRKTFFLLYVLCAVFATQAGMLFYAGHWCAKNSRAPETGELLCPGLGDRYEQTFTMMIQTTLALLTGAHLGSKSDEV